MTVSTVAAVHAAATTFFRMGYSFPAQGPLLADCRAPAPGRAMDGGGQRNDAARRRLTLRYPAV